jgi:biotin transporter BioY
MRRRARRRFRVAHRSRRPGVDPARVHAGADHGQPFAVLLADGTPGMPATGSTGGDLVVFVVTAMLTGWMAGRGQDRDVATAIPAFLAGSAACDAFGPPWLAHETGVPFSGPVEGDNALAWGLYPIVLGDAIEAAIAGLLLAAAWRVRTIVEGD